MILAPAETGGNHPVFRQHPRASLHAGHSLNGLVCRRWGPGMRCATLPKKASLTVLSSPVTGLVERD